jgi:hypothetical protein
LDHYTSQLGFDPHMPLSCIPEHHANTEKALWYGLEVVLEYKKVVLVDGKP